MKRCGILCYFSDGFYKKFKSDKLHFYRFKEDLQYISRELIYSCCVVFAVGGTAEYYADILNEFFPWCCVIGSKVNIEVVNSNYIDYLINECDQIFVFWEDDDNWDNFYKKLEGKEIDLYEMDSVTDDYRSTERYIQQIADDDRKSLHGKRDIDFLKRFNVNYNLKNDT